MKNFKNSAKIQAMRVVSGKFNGIPLNKNKFQHISPTEDKGRQAVFVKLQFFLPGSRVLDLFCGTGAMGIEALSHGAEKVVFLLNHSPSK